MTNTRETPLVEQMQAALEAIKHTGEWYYAGCNTVHDANHDEVAHPCDMTIAEHLPTIRNAAPALLDALTAQAQEIAELRELLRVATCPQCDGSGVVLDERTICVPGCCGQPLRTGECCGNAVPTPELIQEPAPCQWCDERNRAIEGAKQ